MEPKESIATLMLYTKNEDLAAAFMESYNEQESKPPKRMLYGIPPVDTNIAIANLPPLSSAALRFGAYSRGGGRPLPRWINTTNWTISGMRYALYA